MKDFELLCSLGVFNANLMNQAIFSFKRYEDSSLSYTGIDKHEGEDVGGWDTVIKRAEYERMFYNQQATMTISNAIQEPEIEEVITVKTEPKKPVTYKPPGFYNPSGCGKENRVRQSFSAGHFSTHTSQDQTYRRYSCGQGRVRHAKYL